MKGARLGPYEIVAPLGAGGMGEVYRANDTRLKRDVAIKLLPSRFADDVQWLARFEREAEVLASLNHPHIAAVYGFDEGAGTKALVMELVEGVTLADRIALGPIPIDEALSIARQIAAALEAAHERGIVHRDLKPANIKVRDDGTVKVLDFGLAKALEPGGDSSLRRHVDLSQSPTMASPVALTQAGVILGTATYMSPEQARGKPVDKRTDVWAFGAVLYEMLTGTRAFAGDDLADVMASIVKTTPDWDALPADLPPQAVSLIKGCLEKDRQTRIGDIAVARFLLAEASTVPRTPAKPTSAIAVRWQIASALALATLAIGAGIGWLLPRGTTGEAPVTRLQMDVRPADQLRGSIASVRPTRTAMAISPDGRVIVFTGRGGAPPSQLFSRPLDRDEATAIPGTEGGLAPFFSPDGAWIGFWADNTIKKVASAGGPPSAVPDAPLGLGWGASWADDGTIFFATRGIFKVSSAGGTPSPVTTPDFTAGERHLLPHVLPGGRALVFTNVAANWDEATIMLQPLDGGEPRELIRGGTDARYVGTGHLLFMRRGTLMAAPFDLAALQVTGAPAAVIEDVMHGLNTPSGNDETGAGQFAVSPAGTLVYVAGGVSRFLESSFAWIDRQGVGQPMLATPARSHLFPRLSPDGQKVAVGIRRDTSRGIDVWVHDIVRGAPTRLTFDGAGNPVWSPDGKRVAFLMSTKEGAPGLYTMNADGSGAPERVVNAGEIFGNPSSWNRSANALAVVQFQGATGTSAIQVVPMDGRGAPTPFLESRFNLGYAEFSPDGGAMAYVSNESGGPEVYVQPYPGPGEKVRISTNGGNEPLWTRDGRELLYRSSTGDRQQFFSVAITSASPFRADTPRLLFETTSVEYDSTTPVRSWDVSTDGRRLLLMRFAPSTDSPVTTMHVVLNWHEELRRRIPGSGP